MVAPVHVTKVRRRVKETGSARGAGMAAMVFGIEQTGREECRVLQQRGPPIDAVQVVAHLYELVRAQGEAYDKAVPNHCANQRLRG